MIASPYPGLAPYREQDAEFFFGREMEQRVIGANLFASSLTLVYGTSGVGKSSILNAGVLPYLRAIARVRDAESSPTRLVVVAFGSWRDDPFSGLAAAIASAIGDRQPTPGDRSTSLAHNLYEWCQDTNSEVLLLLDQFEEYFLYHPVGVGSTGFDNQLAQCVKFSDPRISVLLSIREESLALLDRFKGLIPNLFGNYLRIDRLSRDAAAEAIRKPIAQLNGALRPEEQYSIDLELVDQLLREVSTGRVVIGETGMGRVATAEHTVDTPYMQLVLSRLWEEERRIGSRTLRRETLAALGGSEHIVRNHLSDALSTLTKQEQGLAASVFHHLVTPSRTKIAYSATDLAVYAGVTREELGPLLERLSSGNRRILSPVAPATGRSGETRYEIFHDILAPAVLDWRTRFVRSQKDEQIEREVQAQRTLLGALHEIGTATVDAMAADKELDLIFDDVTTRLGFDFAIVGLVDDYKETVELWRGRNVAQAWMRASVFRLESRDLWADCVRSGRTEVIDGWDSRFNVAIYERVQHERMARVFVPIVLGDQVIGVLQAGCARERRTDVLSSRNVEELERIILQKSEVIAHARPQMTLELIADRAVEFMSADAASLHVFWDDQLFLQAGAGRATKEFLRKFPPRPQGFAAQALSTRQPVFVDDVRLHEVPSLFADGVRAMVAFPVSCPGGATGVLYISYWRAHAFTPADKELGELFVRQVEVVVENVLLLKSLTKETQKVWDLSGFQNVMQAVASNPDLHGVLQEIARSVLYMVEADSVSLYQCRAGGEELESPPIMVGAYYNSEDPGMDYVWQNVARSQALFFADTSSAEPMLLPEFIRREAIRSCAVLPLRAGSENVGCVFVNYRSAKSFGEYEQRVLSALADSAAIAIRTARMREEEALSLVRLASSATVAMGDASHGDGDLLLRRIVEQAVTLTGAEAGEFLVLDKQTGMLESVFQHGLTHRLRMKLAPDLGLRGRAAATLQRIVVSDVRLDVSLDVAELLSENTRAAIVVPVHDRGDLYGVLALESRRTNAFSARDVQLVDALAIQAAPLLQSAVTRGNVRQQAFAFESLALISTTLYRRRSSTDADLRLILTGITAAEGLRFNTAMLFVVDATGETVSGRIAIGSLGLSEAQVAWDSLRWISESGDISGLLARAEQFAAMVDADPGLDTPLSRRVKSLSFSLSGQDTALTQSLRDGVVRIGMYQHDRLGELLSGHHPSAFLCMPIIGRGARRLGVLAVDNRFTGEQIDTSGSSEMSGLKIYATLIASVLESGDPQGK